MEQSGAQTGEYTSTRRACYSCAVSLRGLIGCAILAVGCRPTSEFVGFGSSSTTGTGTEGTSSTSTGQVDLGSSSTTTIDLDTDSGTTSPRLDLGDVPDLDPPQPIGCKGKIDFLFVISNGQFIESIQDQLVDAFPKFIDTIQTKFADFDYHIMVTDGTASWWGTPFCSDACPTTPEPWCVDYPCAQLRLVGSCETTWGAGTVFNAGEGTLNKPCAIADGRRYMTREQPQLAETFECLARVGGTGGQLLGHMLVSAVSPEINGPGGCNEGFLRDDALLVVTLATNVPDDNSPGTPSEWAEAVIEAKLGDPAAIVALGITVPKYKGECDPMDRICQLVEQFPYAYWLNNETPDYGPAFEVATGLVEEACGAFIPQ